MITMLWCVLRVGPSNGAQEQERRRATGSYKRGSAAAIPFDFGLDYSTDPASIEGTFGGIPANCTIDLDTFAVTC
jgi:hypothetical protein